VAVFPFLLSSFSHSLSLYTPNKSKVLPHCSSLQRSLAYPSTSLAFSLSLSLFLSTLFCSFTVLFEPHVTHSSE